MQSHYQNVFDKASLSLVIPCKVSSVLDLLKLALTPKVAGCYTPNEEVFCYKENGSFAYFIFIHLANVLDLRGVLFEYFTLSDMDPREFIWWNPKTGNVSTHKSPKPEALAADPEEQKDSVEIFSVVNILEMPEWLAGWNHKKK